MKKKISIWAHKFHNFLSFGYEVASSIKNQFLTIGRKYLNKIPKTIPVVNRKLWLKIITVTCIVTGAAWLPNAWILLFSKPYLFDDIKTVSPKYTAIVLGAKVFPNGTPSATLQDRLSAAHALYHAKKIKKIIVSGDHAAKEYDEVNAMRNWLVNRDVNPRDIFLDHAGFRTLDTMERAKKVFQVKDAIICTQRFHLARAVFLARRAGIEAVGLVADKRVYAAHHKNNIREFIARNVAFLDSYVFATSAQYTGKAIPVTGDASSTHDRWTSHLNK